SKDVRTGNNDLGTARADSLHAHAILVLHLREFFCQLAHALRERDGAFLAGTLLLDEMAGLAECGGGARGRDDRQHAHWLHAALGTAQLAREDRLKAGKDV